MARLGPARNPASTSSSIASDSTTGSPSKRSTARRRPRPARTWSASAASAGRSQSGLGSRSGTSDRPPRSTYSIASPPTATTYAPAALASRHRPSAARDAVRAGDAGGAPPRPPRPRQRRTVRLRGIGGGEHERLCVLVALAVLAQALDAAAERELGASKPLDEVAATAEPERLERAQLGIDGAVAAGD